MSEKLQMYEQKYGKIDRVMNDCFPCIEKLGVRFTYGTDKRICHRWYWAQSQSFFNVKKFRLDKPKSPADNMQFRIYNN
jgi:hypothetical protein